MSVKIRCPECSEQVGVVERMLGKEIACPNCAVPIQLPSREVYEKAMAKRKEKALASAGAAKTAVTRPKATATVATIPAVVAPTPVPPTPPADEEEELGGYKNRDTSEMDMTPMIDVTFLLLIFFVVTASFQIQKAMQVPKSQSDAPSSKPSPKDEMEEVTVLIDPNNTFMVLAPTWEREAAGRQMLMSTLREARNEDPEAPMRLVVKAHVDSKHKTAVEALDIGTELRFSEMKVVEVEE
jgi:biopolymer transport protein ExbD